MSHSPIQDKKLYGTATVGTKGQVVIPAEARDAMNIQPGDRLYVIGDDKRGFIGLLKEDTIESMMQHLSEQIENFRSFQKEEKK